MSPVVGVPPATVQEACRRHSSCEMLPPVAYEQLLAERGAGTAPADRAA